MSNTEDAILESLEPRGCKWDGRKALAIMGPLCVRALHVGSP